MKSPLPWAEFLSTICWNGELYYPRDGSSYNCSYFAQSSLPKIRAVWRKTLDLIQQGKAPKDIGIYIHWPFCPSRCDFCACSMAVPDNNEDIDSIYAMLLSEIDSFSDIFRGVSLSSLWMGGGTPTFMPDKTLDSLLAHIRRSFAFSTEAQIYVEASPATLTASKLGVLLRHGMNRITLGIQSFDDEVIAAVDRRGQTRQDTVNLFKKLKSVPGLVTDVDIMIGIQGQSPDIFLNDIKSVLELRPHLLHVYGFDDRPQTLWATREGKLTEEQGRAREVLLDHADRILRGAKYRAQWDDSSHPILYPWEEKQDGALRKIRASVLGIGPSAMSHAFGSAFYAHPAVGNFKHEPAPRFLWMESSIEEEMRGYVIWHFASIGRVSRRAFRKIFGKDIMETELSRALFSWQDRGLACIGEDDISLRPMGVVDRAVLLKRLYSGRIVSALIKKWGTEFKRFKDSFSEDGFWRDSAERKNGDPGFRVYHDSKFWDT